MSKITLGQRLFLIYDVGPTCTYNLGPTLAQHSHAIWVNAIRKYPVVCFESLRGARAPVADPERNLGGGSRGPKGRVGRLREGCPLPLVGVGGLPEKILKKMMQNGAIWSVNKAF